MVTSKKEDQGKLNLEGMIAHLDNFRRERGYLNLNPCDLYFIGESGIYYVLEHISLSEQEIDEAKKAASRSLCLQEALHTKLIPAGYLQEVLKTFLRDLEVAYGSLHGNARLPPDFLEELAVVVGQYFLASSEMINNFGRRTQQYTYPSPFAFNKGEGPFILLMRGGMEILNLANGLAENSIGGVLKTQEKSDMFNYGWDLVKTYLTNYV